MAEKLREYTSVTTRQTEVHNRRMDEIRRQVKYKEHTLLQELQKVSQSITEKSSQLRNELPKHQLEINELKNKINLWQNFNLKRN